MKDRGLRRITLLGILILALIPPAAWLTDQPFYVDLFTRIMIFAIGAVSLDLILGYGGMLSFGHAVYLGIGAYTVGILEFYGVSNGPLQFAAAAATCAVAASFIGAVSLRTAGGYFIMITLAFAQMFFFFFVSLKVFGGDDGFRISEHSDFGKWLDLGDGLTFYYFVFAILVLFLWIGFRIVESRFGMVLRGAKVNQRRMAALGFPVFRYRLAGFVISAAMCGVAGALFANLTLFISPSLMHWTRSGELMVMVIMGGIGSLFGPVLGATAYLLIEDSLSGFTADWQLIFGPILVIGVMVARRGILGLLTRRSGGIPHG